MINGSGDWTRTNDTPGMKLHMEGCSDAFETLKTLTGSMVLHPDCVCPPFAAAPELHGHDERMDEPNRLPFVVAPFLTP